MPTSAVHSLLHTKLPLGMADGNGNIVEDAETHWLVTLTVVSGRTIHRETIADLHNKRMEVACMHHTKRY